MKKSCLSIAALVGAFTFFQFAPSTTAEKAEKFFRSSKPVPNKFIVVLDETAGEVRADLAATINRLNYEHPGAIDKVYTSALSAYSVEMTDAEAELLSNDPSVKYVEQDGYVSTAEAEFNPGWGLDRIDQRSLPYDYTYNYMAGGSGVRVYILDSGILTTHVELQGRAFDAYDAVHDNTPISQCNGHGTGVAGVVGSSTYGVAKQTLLYSVRVLPCQGYGTVSDVISGVDWVTRRAVKPAVANMSLETGYSKAMNDAVASSIASGVTYVVAAGNDGDDACRYSPSSYTGTIAVGAINNIDERLVYSNFGACVDLFAPGEGISTIWNSSDTTMTYASGTSFASPYIVGIAALYLEQHPLASPGEVASAVSSTATGGVVGNPGSGSPNLLAYSMFPQPEPGTCPGTPFSGTLSGSGSVEYQSSSSGFNGGSGTYSATLSPPAGAVFSLSLEKKSKNRWSAVATSDAGQPIAYRGKNGTYRWRVADVSGGGGYSLCSVTP
jgi:subtilisin family serine protease